MKSVIFILIALIIFFVTLFLVWRAVGGNGDFCSDIDCPKGSEYFISENNYYPCECDAFEDLEPFCFKTEEEAREAGYIRGNC